MIIHLFILSSAVQIFEFSYIHFNVSSPQRVYNEFTQWPAPSWLDSSIGRALHRYRRGHGFESHSSLNFFSGFLFATNLSCVYNSFYCSGHLFILSSAVQIYEFSYIHFNKTVMKSIFIVELESLTVCLNQWWCISHTNRWMSSG